MRGLLHQERDPDEEVARFWDPELRTHHIHRWQDFRRHVVGLHARLADLDEGPIVLLTEHAYEFAVGLFAVLHAGREAVLPPNPQPGALARLAARTAGTISDIAEAVAGIESIHPIVEGRRADAHALERLGVLDRQSPCIELYTSGTTGAERPVRKRIHHIEDEIEQLSQLWEGRVRGARVYSTASHLHFYGLLFGVLWPLCTRRSFVSRRPLQPGELLPRMLDDRASVLVGVPTQLRQLARRPDLGELRGRCRLVFSSGGLLPTEIALALENTLGHAPIEVLGSTETGGIAWRRVERGQDKTPWEAFPTAEVARNAAGILCVRSPLVSERCGPLGFVTGDRIAFDEGGRFHLEGRANRVVKVGEKRLDLDVMEARLHEHPWVERVALLTVERGAGLRVAAAVVPSAEGAVQIGEAGQRAFRDALRASLAADWDPVLQPRHWRILARLPENARGKIRHEALARLFDTTAAVEARSDAFENLDELRGEDFIEIEGRVPGDLACLPGHFPGSPIVPGVLQLDWAMDVASRLVAPEPLEVVSIESMKWLRPLLPLARFRMRVHRPKRDRVDVELWNDEGRIAAGTLTIAPGRPAHERGSGS